MSIENLRVAADSADLIEIHRPQIQKQVAAALAERLALRRELFEGITPAAVADDVMTVALDLTRTFGRKLTTEIADRLRPFASVTVRPVLEQAIRDACVVTLTPPTDLIAGVAWGELLAAYLRALDEGSERL